MADKGAGRGGNGDLPPAPCGGSYEVPDGDPYRLRGISWVRLNNPVPLTPKLWVTHYKFTYLSELPIPTVRETQVHVHTPRCGCDLVMHPHDVYLVKQQSGNTVTVNSGFTVVDVTRVTTAGRGFSDPPPGSYPPS